VIINMDFNELILQYDDLINMLSHKYSIKGYTWEDIKQECLMKLWESYSLYNGSTKWSTFIYNVLENHIKDLIKKSITQKNNNYIGDNIISDIKNYNFDMLLNELPIQYNELEEKYIEKFYTLLERVKNKDIIIRRLYGETYMSIANEFEVSKQYIHQIFTNFIKKVKEEVIV